MSQQTCVADAATDYNVETRLQNASPQHQGGGAKGEKNFRCTVCDRLFDSASRLESHRAANACPAHYSCRFCTREFRGANELAHHAESAHSDPRMCVLCGRLLSRKDKLENHVRTHTGEQPFECKFCRKRFSRRDRCNEHEKLHQGVSFKCGECQKSFSRRDKMRAHLMRSHHDRYEWYEGGGATETTAAAPR